MKLLFDQNISFRVVKALQNVFHEAAQVKELGLQNTSDKQVWDFAKKNKYTIVTFDSDFEALATLFGHPPKIIWLRTGNISSSELIDFLKFHQATITEFLTAPEFNNIACLELG